jgi:hypothetical protein
VTAQIQMNLNQAPHSLLMIRPASFGHNPQTAASNVFQSSGEDPAEMIQLRAVDEFNRMVALLETHDIDVRVFDDTSAPAKPDVLFPNNWVSFHEDGKVVLYPMLAENRRLERRPDIIGQLKTDFLISEVVDYSKEENNGRYLEGTGSLVFDYINRIAYACRSSRTDISLVREVCDRLGYRPVVFDAVDEHGVSIYHTNVMMCLGTTTAVLCLDAIPSEDDQDLILDSLAETGHKVVAISYSQLRSFAGNMYEVRSTAGERYLLLSRVAFESLVPGQVDALSRDAELIPVPVETIEKYGGGSVRCMVAGIYLPTRSGLHQ